MPSNPVCRVVADVLALIPTARLPALVDQSDFAQTPFGFRTRYRVKPKAAQDYAVQMFSTQILVERAVAFEAKQYDVMALILECERLDDRITGKLGVHSEPGE